MIDQLSQPGEISPQNNLDIASDYLGRLVPIEISPLDSDLQNVTLQFPEIKSTVVLGGDDALDIFASGVRCNDTEPYLSCVENCESGKE